MKRLLALFTLVFPLALQAQSKLAQNIIDDFSNRAAYHYTLKNDSITGYIAEQLNRSGSGGIDVDATMFKLAEDQGAFDASLKYLYQYSDCNRQRFIENLKNLGLKNNSIFPIATYTANKYKDQSKDLLEDKKDFLVTYTGPNTGKVPPPATVATVQHNADGTTTTVEAAEGTAEAIQGGVADSSAAAPVADTRDWEVKPIFKTRNAEQLLTMYGKENVILRDGSDISGNATGKNAFVVYPDTDNELQIEMDGDEGNTLLFSLEHTKWKTPFGIKPGDPLEKLVKINGRPFKFNGFEWTDSGLVSSWEGGQLNGKGVEVVLRANNTGDPKLYDQVTGDKTIRSDNAALKKLNIVIQSITFKSN
ncbi:hypothetical protein SAMN05444266_10645 [Chitinophaga jiangningensis]|uniref:DUF4296 domain-containing protein n=1 Tax=Chitinophaga jiangningensis TaxID=1419482 RepID=A0A1M7FA51_9BACT|nr:hypothetical protein [Chitinophaga jiangningensis]SHM00579.1 hypothetical protein SAMN05444266_10645 [Chitinophaga jiangningensis]